MNDIFDPFPYFKIFGRRAAKSFFGPDMAANVTGPDPDPGPVRVDRAQDAAVEGRR
jgi:hypothetical protein